MVTEAGDCGHTVLQFGCPSCKERAFPKEPAPEVPAYLEPLLELRRALEGLADAFARYEDAAQDALDGVLTALEKEETNAR